MTKTLPQLTALTSPPSLRAELLVNSAGNPRRMSVGKVLGAAGFVCVNDFYDGVNATGPTGTSRPLSTWYGTLGAAQADYPRATALTDEVDWSAWMEALRFAYDKSAIGVAGGEIVADSRSGSYVVNKTIECNLTSPYIHGTTSNFGNPIGANTQIVYNGVDGTIDAPIPILRCRTVGWNAGAATWNTQFTQPGSSTQSPNATGPSPTIERLTFFGKDGNMLGLVGNESGFINGIEIGNAAASIVRYCTFGGCLWDGIVHTGPSTTTLEELNNFYGVYRDGINYCEIEGGGVSAFSTTMWIRKNTYGYVGRYAWCLNGFNTIGATPIICDNVLEPQAGNYFSVNPASYIHGVPALAVIFGVSQPHIYDTYLEINITGLGILHIADSLLGHAEILGGGGDGSSIVASSSRAGAIGTSVTISGTTMTIAGTVSGGIFFVGQAIFGTGITPGTYITALPGGGGGVAGAYTISASHTISSPITVGGATRTPEAVAYAHANGYCDVTNTRNYVCGQNDAASYSGGISDFLFTGIGNLHTVGGIRFSGQNRIDKGIVNTVDFAVVTQTVGGKARVLAAIAYCTAGQIINDVLTVDATAAGAPFAVGQTVWGPGLVGQGPLRSTKTITSQLTGSAGGAGTYRLSSSVGGTSAVQPIYACVMTQKSIDDLGVFSAIGSSLVAGTSLTTAVTIAQPKQQQNVYLKAYNVFEVRQSIDNAEELVFWNEIFLREGNNLNVDGSSSDTWNGYMGLTLNRFTNNITTDNTDLPFIFGRILDKDGVAVRYVETAVLTGRKIRYNFTDKPVSGTWNRDDIVWFKNATAGGRPGAVCVTGGTPGTWKYMAALEA